jgi:hypothetical protein
MILQHKPRRAEVVEQTYQSITQSIDPLKSKKIQDDRRDSKQTTIT